MAEATFPRNPYHGQVYVNPENGATYVYDKTKESWFFTEVVGAGGSGDGGSKVSLSEAPPYPANQGDLWVQLPAYFLYVFDSEVDATGGKWIGLTNNGGDNTQVHVGPKAPEGAVQKHTFWFDSNSGDLRILYADDGKTAGAAGQPAPASTQWVTVTANGQSIGTSAYVIAQLEELVQQLQGEIEDLKEQLGEVRDQFAIGL